MSQTVGPVLAIGAVTIVNQSIFHGKPIDWRVPAATALAATGFALAERAWPQGAELLAWTALLTILLTRTDPAIPSPVESALSWWNTSSGKSGGKAA
jgi:hypothetical protein